MKQIISTIALVLSVAACTSKQPAREKAAPVMVETTLKVEGMHCDNCEASIVKGVGELAGIGSISANYEDSTAFVRFDTVQVNLAQITAAIEKRGYRVARN